MANEETIVNRIITVNEIEQIANYLENKKDDYERLINIDENKNRGLKFTWKMRQNLYHISINNMWEKWNKK